jgi:lipoate-protein ligase A
MAVDLAMQRARASGRVPPTVRLYGFAPRAASLGRFQRAADADLDACARLGIDVCRRPTGGRGVLHDDEVTYSVVASTQDGLPSGVAASYAFLSAALEWAYESMGVSARLGTGSGGDRTTSACYLQSSRADLVCDGGKLSGSAQVWDGDTCLQHGSVVLSRDIESEAAVFRLSGESAATLATRAVTLEEILGAPPSRDAAVAALERGFSEALGVRLRRGELTTAETVLAAQLEGAARVSPLGDVSQAQQEVEGGPGVRAV